MAELHCAQEGALESPREVRLDRIPPAGASRNGPALHAQRSQRLLRVDSPSAFSTRFRQRAPARAPESVAGSQRWEPRGSTCARRLRELGDHCTPYLSDSSDATKQASRHHRVPAPEVSVGSAISPRAEWSQTTVSYERLQPGMGDGHHLPSCEARLAVPSCRH